MAARRLLSRSLSFVSDAANQVNSDFQRGQRLYKSFGKGKDTNLQRGQICRRKDSATSVKIKDGFLWIQSSLHMKRNWKVRYVMLLEEKLCYLKELRDKNPQAAEWKVIKIADIVSVKISGDGQTHHISDSDTFCVKTSRSKTLFRCNNQDERDKWMTALLTAKSSSMLKERKTSSEC